MTEASGSRWGGWAVRIGLGLIAVVALIALAIRLWPLPSYAPYDLDARERAFVESISVPAFAPDWSFRTYESFDGTRLRWGETGNAATARATLIYVPGFNGTLDAYAEQFGLWARAGFHVVGLDMRGQGGSAGNLVQYGIEGERLPPFVQDGEVLNVRDMTGFVRSLGIRDRPVVLVGSSYGGLMSTLAIMAEPGLVDAYLALVPAYQPKLPGKAQALERQTRLVARLGLGARYAPEQGDWRPFTTQPDWCPTGTRRIFHQVAIQANDASQRVGGVTFANISDWLRLGREVVAGARGAFDVPTAMILVTDDALVETAPARGLCAREPLCELYEWDDVTHCVTLGMDADLMRVAGVVDELLERVE